MWTPNTPYIESQKTESSIEQHGRIALSRALNIGRVVGFIGSGVTIAYGRPSWSELVELIVERFDSWREVAGRLPPEVQGLCDQLDFLFGRIPGNDDRGPLNIDRLAAHDQTTILEIIDNLFAAINAVDAEGLGTLRSNVADLLRGDRGALAKARFSRHVGTSSAIPENFDWTCPDAEQMAYFLAATGSFSRPAQGELDPIDKIFDTLRIKRFLTLNFDVEIERYLAKVLDIAASPPGPARAQLLSLIGGCQAGEGLAATSRRIAIETGLERTLLTVTMSEENVGELVNFAMYPNAYSAQVFHLHGRIDDPESMVITERDYQRIYMPDDQGRRTFREALENVFAGNDVLFMGVGMKETDIMRPLRQFVSQDRSPDSEARRVFALMEQIVDSDPGTLAEEQISSDRQKEIQRALRLNIQYGVFTIVYGGADSRFARMALRAIRGFAEGVVTPAHARELLLAAVAQRDKRQALWSNHGPARSAAFRELITDSEVSELRELLDIDLDRDISQPPIDGLPGTGLPSRRAAIAGYARSMESRVRVRALCRELDALADRSARWWKEWRRTPRERLSIFRELRVNPRHSIWVRHKADYTAIEPGDILPGAIERLQEWGHAIGDPANAGGRRMLCVAIERGGGKGALTHLLQQPVPGEDEQRGPRAIYETIFPEVEYSGAFFAHLAFSMEFSSVISALTRFLAGRLAAIHDLPAEVRHQMERSPGAALEQFTIEDGLSLASMPRGTHRLSLLRRLLLAFERSPRRNGRKIFICLSGLNRLCDSQGLARHPMHRAFFRLLSGEGLVKPGESPASLPIDLLVLSANANHPIRHLSEECDLAQFDRRVQRLRAGNRPGDANQALELIEGFDRRPDMGVAIRHWPVLEPIAWHERYWQFKGRDAATRLAAQELRGWNPPFGPPATGDSAVADGDPVAEAPPTHSLNRLLQQNVAFSAWMCAAWRELADFLHERGERRETMQNWMERLDAAAARRPSYALEEILKDYDRMDNAHGQRQRAALHDALLRHLALFTLPVELGVLYDCPDIQRLLTGGEKCSPDHAKLRQQLTDALDILCARALVIRVSADIHADEDAPRQRPLRHYRYVLHSQLRDHFAHKMGLSVSELSDRNDFQMTVYCDQPRDLPTPSVFHYQLLRRILDTQIRLCRETLWPFYQLRRAESGRTTDPGDHLRQWSVERDRKRARKQLEQLLASKDSSVGEEARLQLYNVPHRIRACYGLLRGAFSIGSISRLDGIENGDAPRDLLDPPFERFRGWLLSLVNASVGLDEVGPYIDAALSGELSLDALDSTHQPVGSSLPKQQVNRFHRPLYREEIAWLYNERGLVSLVQGRLFDAMPLFDRAYQITRHKAGDYREDPSFRASERRIHLNIAIAHIERGNLDEARRILLAISRDGAAAAQSPMPTAELAKGYLGVVDHLSGHFEQAQAAYRRVVDRANSDNQLRLVSIFNRHWSDLLRLIGDHGEADRRADFAVSTATQSEQRDVLHLALLSKARIHRDRQEREKALALLRECETYARRLGVPRIQVEAAQVLAKIMLLQGEETLAGATAARALALAGRHGMRLRKVSCLALYGDILEQRNQMTLAARVRSEARIYAERLGYQIKAGRLAEALARQEI